MRYKIFGERTGLKVSELALGTAMFGRTWGYGATPEEAERLIEGFATRAATSSIPLSGT